MTETKAKKFLQYYRLNTLSGVFHFGSDRAEAERYLDWYRKRGLSATLEPYYPMFYRVVTPRSRIECGEDGKGARDFLEEMRGKHSNVRLETYFPEIED